MRQLPRAIRDALLPGAVAIVAVAEMAGTRGAGWQVAALLEVVACGLLVWRRHRPLALASASLLAILLIPWVGPQMDEASAPILILTIAVYSLARWLPDLRGLAGVAMGLAGLFVNYHWADSRHHNWSDVLFVLALVTPPFVLGRITRKLAEQKAMLESQQELVRREAIHAERERIARELHDVIAHSVSAMVVQAAAAQDLVKSAPERAEAMLATVADTGRSALTETSRLLHMIRDDADELGLRPTPGLSRLPELVEQFRQNGLDIRASIDANLPQLPAGVDVSAYRIVQEALTNALKYGDRTLALEVEMSQTMLSIRASNPSTAARGTGSGLGLVGMAERVALLGGRLVHGTTAEGRFEVVASIPVFGGAQA